MKRSLGPLFSRSIVSGGLAGASASGRRRRRSRGDGATARRRGPAGTSLSGEPLEGRAMLAIDYFSDGPISNYLIVTSSPDAPGAAADDVFITRTAANELMIANNSSFAPRVLGGSNADQNFEVPDTLYVTNGVRADVQPLLSPGNNRSLVNGGPGYKQDGVVSQTTTYVLKHGAINASYYIRGSFNSLIPLPTYPSYDNDQGNFGFEIDNRVLGRVAYVNPVTGLQNAWAFEIAPNGRVYFRQVNGDSSGPRPVEGRLFQGDQRFQGIGFRGNISIDWSAPVPTVPHMIAGGITTPVLETISYTADWDTARSGNSRPDYVLTESNIAASATSTQEFLFDVGNAGTMIDGTLRGTINIATVPSLSGLGPGISIDFSTDLLDGNHLYFFGHQDDRADLPNVFQTVGYVDWLRVSGTYLGNGQIELSFQNRFADDGSRTSPESSAPRYRPQPVQPGPVTITDLTFAEYVTPEKASDFTLFAGYDLESQVWADLRAPGSTINIDSPVVVSRRPDGSISPDVDLRATTVNIDARVASGNDLFVGASRSGTVTETLAVNASVRVPREARIYVEDEHRTTPTGLGDLRGPDRGKLLISQTGSIAATFYTTAPQFGNSGVPTVATESERNDDGVSGGSLADFAQANDLSGSFVPLGDNIHQATVTGTISDGNDQDWDFFEVPLRANDIMEISLVGVGLGDSYLRLFRVVNGLPVQVGADDDGGAGLNSFLSYVNGNADGSVYIAADSFGGSRGSYTLTVTVRGSSATPTATILVTAVKSDVLIEGTVFGVSQSYLMRSAGVDAALNTAPYSLSTKSQRTGARSGLIRGDIVQAILANDADTPLDLSIAYNVVDLNTAVNSLRVRASVRQNGVETSASGPFPYQLTVREENAVSIDAVAASTRPISVTSDGSIVWTAALNTAGDVGITTRNVGNTLNSFVCSAPITTTHGTIAITASDIAVGSSLIVSDAAPRSPDRTDIVLDAGNGNVTLTGLVQSPNRIRIGQTTPGTKAGRVAGSGKVKTRDLFINAVTIGNPEADPRTTQFFLRTEVDSLQVDAKNGVAIDEADDITVTQLRSPAGLVALRAAGADNRAGSPNAIALTANLRDIVNLFVSAPDGSIVVRNDSAERLVLGMQQDLEQGTVDSMKAAGNVSIVSTAGGIDVLDAPFGGSGASITVAQTETFLRGTYNAGLPGQRASTITGNDAIASLVAVGQPFGKAARSLNVNDRVLVSRGAGASEADPSALHANGIYVVTSDGRSGENWVLTRVTDADTFEEFPSSTIVYASDINEYFVCTHAMTSSADFGKSPVTVAGFKPTTQIGVAVVVPQNDIRYVVSSTGGTNVAAGSLGKMMTIAQVNQPGDPDQRQGFAFSSTLPGKIVLTQQLPEIVTPLQIDGNVRWTAGAEGVVPSGPIVVNGQFITTSSLGGELYRGSVSATVKRADRFRLLLPANFSDTRFLRVGMPATGIGISSGSRIVSITPAAVSGSGNTEVVLDRIVSASFDGSGTGNVSVTFATALDGLRFAAGSDNAAVGNIFIGGFENGAAIAVTSENVSITRAVVGMDSDGNRLSNTSGVLVTGSATITGGSVVSSTAAGVQTGSLGKLGIVGTTIGLEKLPNVEGVRIGGTRGVMLGRDGAAGTTVQFNRVGVVIENGKNEIVNTTIARNSYDGIVIEGGETTIGPAATPGTVVTGRNAIFANGGWGVVISGPTSGNEAGPIRDLASRQDIRQNLFLSPTDLPGVRPLSNRKGAIGLASTGSANANSTVSDYSSTNQLHRVANGVDQKGNRYVAIPDTVGPVLLVAAALGLSDNNLLEADNRTVKGTNANFVRAFVLTLKDDASGVAAGSVDGRAFEVSVGSRKMVEGSDYLFVFSGVESGEVRFTTLSGTGYFPQGQYTITATGQAKVGSEVGRLVDTAGNVLQGDPSSARIATRVFVLADVPGAPTNVNGNAEDSGVLLTWDPPQTSVIPVTNYIIQYRKGDAASWTTVSNSDSTDTSIRVPNLELGVGYFFRVAAENAAGAGDFSTVSPQITPRALASVPRDLQAVAGDRNVVLTWSVPISDGGDAITSYIVEQRVNADGTWSEVNKAVTATTLTIDGLDNGKSYTFRVTAQTSSGRGAPAVTGAVVPAALPDRVGNVRAIAQNTRATLDWVAPSSNGTPITDYVVQSSTDGGETWVDHVDGVNSATTAVVTGLVNGTAYVFRVAAVSRAGTGEYSIKTGVVIPGNAPLAPTNLQGVPGDGRAVLNWSVPSVEGDAPINDYVVESSEDGGVTWIRMDDGVSTATTSSMTGLTNGIGYLFRVAAVSRIGQSDWAVGSAVVPAALPSSPSGVTAVLVNGEVVVTWTEPDVTGGSPIIDYVLQSSTDGGSNWVTVDDGQTIARAATFANLAVGVGYTFRVAAVNDVGIGNFSSASPVVTVVTAPQPVGPLVVVAAARSATLSWTMPSSTGGLPITDYLIEYRASKSAFWTVVARPRSTSTSAVVAGLVPGTGYFFRVTAITDFGVSTPTATTVAIVPMNAPTRLSGRVVNNTISLGWIAPRPPAGSRIVNYRVQYSMDAGATWTTVERLPSAAPRGSISRLPKGIYTFRVAAVTTVGVGAYSAKSAFFRVVR
jgi:hypothetical protein